MQKADKMGPGSGIAAVFFRGLADTVWGRRGLVKTNSLWFPLSLFLSSRVTSLPNLSNFLFLTGAVACWAAGSILVNDIADSGNDRSAGKHRWIVELAAPVGVSFVIIVWVVGGLLTIGSGDVTTLAAYGGAVVFSLFYSIEPFRLKRSGRWGLLSYSGACTLAYVGMPWIFLNGSVQCLAVLAPTVFLDKWVNLQFHQVIDIDSDLISGESTHAAAIGKEPARRELIFFARLASVAMSIAFACALYLLPFQRWLVASAGIGAVVATGAFARIRCQASGSSLMQELPWHYLGLTYGVLRITPATIFLCLAYWHRALAPLAAIVFAFVFWETLLSFRYRRP